MNRNLNRKIEVGFPMLDNKLEEQVKHMMELQMSDNVKLSSIADQSQAIGANSTGDKVRA